MFECLVTVCKGNNTSENLNTNAQRKDKNCFIGNLGVGIRPPIMGSPSFVPNFPWHVPILSPTFLPNEDNALSLRGTKGGCNVCNWIYPTRVIVVKLEYVGLFFAIKFDD